MFESIVLGLIQGITEWLPISSEGLITLVEVNFFHQDLTMSQLIEIALFLHLGTFLAALVLGAFLAALAFGYGARIN